MMQNLSDCFHTHLEARIANSEKLKKDAHRVRFKVYCVERGYEDCDKFPDRLEVDDFDSESVHAVVRYKSTKYPVGVVRMVLPNYRTPKRRFPIEAHFEKKFDAKTLEKFDFRRNNIGEVSRFAVSKQALKQIQEQLVSEALDTEQTTNRSDPKELLPHISLGLIAMLFAISKEHGLDYWYAAMEPSLSRLLTRLGIKFVPIGPIMDYHGRRQPMIANVNDLLRNIKRSRKDFYKLITDIGGVFSPETQPSTSMSRARMMDVNHYKAEARQH